MVADARTRGELLCLPARVDGGTIELGYRGASPDGAVIEFTETIELPGTLDPSRVGAVPLLRLLSSPRP